MKNYIPEEKLDILTKELMTMREKARENSRDEKFTEYTRAEMAGKEDALDTVLLLIRLNTVSE